ncbi:MAG: transposase, partial [Candidatus Methylomirabilota bacterium]
MPRQARLDCPGTLHHVMLRGIERGAIVTDDTDRENLLTRLGNTATATGTAIYAWAVLANHVHLLCRSGPRGLPVFMRRWLTGYAVSYNKRHRRAGHLFQNRYKSIVVDEDMYFHELVRYIHLNPLRAGLVDSLRALDRYPWAGHATLLGHRTVPWQERRAVLAWFGRPEARAVRAYRAYVAAGIPLGRRPDLVGGGLVRSLGGWAAVRAMRPRIPEEMADPRILGGGDFVETLLHEAEARQRPRLRPAERERRATALIEAGCSQVGISPAEFAAGGRRGAVSTLRAAIAQRLVADLGFSLADVARRCGVTTSAISRAVQRAAGSEG